MIRFIDLCVELRAGNMAKEGLIQYKALTNNNPILFETIVKYYLTKATEAARDAQAKADELELELGDLDEDETTAEQLMLAVTGEGSKERTERIVDKEVVTPWIKFLWETYRNVLDCFRHSKVINQLYKDITNEAFAFCLKYRRFNEFRRLNELLRQHHLKSQFDDESIQFLLDIKLSQLNTAVALETWQEAFRTLEDINSILLTKNINPTGDFILNYYDKLAKIFWVSENYLFHANALLKYYHLTKLYSKESEEITEDPYFETKIMLACLSIPLHHTTSNPQNPLKCNQYFTRTSFQNSLVRQVDEMSEYFETNIEREKNTKLAFSLGFSDFDPIRESILQDILSSDIPKKVVEELNDLYVLLEEKFQPLKLGKILQEKLAFLQSKPEISQYYKTISNIGAIRILQQTSRVYKFLKIDSLVKLIPFISDRNDVEKMILFSIKNKLVECKIDHKLNTIVFDVKSAESNNIKSCLADILRNISLTVSMVEPESVKQARFEAKKKHFLEIMNRLEDEHKVILERKARIENAKVEREKIMEEEQRKLELEERERQRKLEEEALANKKAALEAQEAKQLALKKKELELQEKKLIKEKLKEIAKRFGAKINKAAEKKFDEGAIDNKTFIDSQIKIIIGEKEKAERKLIDTTERLDHIVRARREKELLHIKEAEEKRKQRIAEHLKLMQNLHSKHQRAVWEANKEHKQRLTRIAEDRKAFENAVLEERRRIHQLEEEERQRKLKEIKAKREEELRLQREREEKEREERRKREEELRLQREKEEKEKEAKKEEAPKKYVPPSRRTMQEESEKPKESSEPAPSKWARGQSVNKSEVFGKSKFTEKRSGTSPFGSKKPFSKDSPTQGSWRRKGGS